MSKLARSQINFKQYIKDMGKYTLGDYTLKLSMNKKFSFDDVKGISELRQQSTQHLFENNASMTTMERKLVKFFEYYKISCLAKETNLLYALCTSIFGEVIQTEKIKMFLICLDYLCKGVFFHSLIASNILTRH